MNKTDGVILAFRLLGRLIGWLAWVWWMTRTFQVWGIVFTIFVILADSIGAVVAFLPVLPLIGVIVAAIMLKDERWKTLALRSIPLVGDGMRIWEYSQMKRATKRATRFLIQSSVISSNYEGYAPAFMFDHGDWVELNIIGVIDGVSTKQLTNKVGDFKNILNAVRVQSDQLPDGGLKLTFFRKDPLDEGQVIDTPAALDEQKMKVECAIDSNGDRMSIEFGGSSGMVVGGVPGSGKTAGVSSFLLPLALSPAVNLTIVDGKGGEDWESYAGAAGAYIRGDEDLEPIRALLKTKYDEMLARVANMKSRVGTSNFWNADVAARQSAGMPMELIVVDECQGIFERAGRSRDDQKLMDEIYRYTQSFVKRGRSAGFFIIFITQKPTVESIPSAIRDNCGLRVAFLLKTDMAEEAVLGARQPTDPTATDIPYSRKGGAVMADDAGNLKAVRFFYMPEDTQGRLLEQVASRGVQKTSVSATADDGEWGWEQ